MVIIKSNITSTATLSRNNVLVMLDNHQVLVLTFCIGFFLPYEMVVCHESCFIVFLKDWLLLRFSIL